MSCKRLFFERENVVCGIMICIHVQLMVNVVAILLIATQ